MFLFAVALLAGIPAPGSTGLTHQFAPKAWAAQDGARARAQRLVHPDSAPPPDRAVSQYQHDRWTTADGLPNHAIDWIQRSSDGYLWLGTEGGLVRFDGVRFTPFDRNSTPALRGTAFYPTVPLHVDRQGVLWIATSGGMVRYKDGKFTRAASAPEPHAPLLSQMVEDRAGRLWVWAQDTDSPLYGIRDGRLVPPDPQSGLPAHVSAVAADPGGDVWVATVDRGLLRVHEAQAISVLTRDATPAGVTALYVARDSVLWVGTQRGFGRLQHGRFEFRHLGAGGLDGYVSAFTEDAAGDVWLGTVGMGVLRWHAGRLEQFDRRDGLSRNQVTSLLVDSEGSVWVGTRGGLDRLRRGAVATFTPRNGGPPFADPGALLWERGRFVVGGATTGLVAGLLGAWAPLPGAEAAARGKIWTIAQGKSGIWIGGDDTLKLYRTGAAPRAYTARDGLAGKWMLAVAEDSLERVWVGTNQGLFRLTRGRVRAFSASDGLPDGYVRTLVVDRRGAVWAGTNRGIARVVGDSVKSWGLADGLAGPLVFTIRESQDGSIWIGTSGGLTRVRDGRLASFRAEQGLTGEMVIAIEEAGGDLWIDTGSGISRVPLTDLDAVADGRAARVRATTFGTRDGLPSTEVVAGAQPLSARTPDGRLWFSTAAGLAVIDPRNLGGNDVALNVLVETVRIDGRELAPSDLTAIPAGSSALEIDYTATGLSFPERVQFRYRLEGVDPSWREVGTRRRAYYTDLGPGSYHFRVSANTGDGHWIETGTRWSFRVLPAWYQTLWSRALAFLLISSLGGLVVALAQRRRHARAQGELKRQYEAALAERTRVAEDLHDTLLQGFAGINLQLIAAELAIPRQPDVAAATLVRVQRLTEESLREARERVWEMRDAALASDDLATALETIARDRTAGMPVEVEVTTTGNSRRLPPSVLDASFRIGREAIVNSVRHAEASRIEIDLDFRPNTFYLEVRDNGRGVSPNQAAGARKAGHFGVSSIQNRASLMGGRCEVRPRPSGGTIVALELPLATHRPTDGNGTARR